MFMHSTADRQSSSVISNIVLTKTRANMLVLLRFIIAATLIKLIFTHIIEERIITRLHNIYRDVSFIQIFFFLNES